MLRGFAVPPEYEDLRAAVDELAGERPNIDFALAAMTAGFGLPPDAPRTATGVSVVILAKVGV